MRKLLSETTSNRSRIEMSVSVSAKQKRPAQAGFATVVLVVL